MPGEELPPVIAPVQADIRQLIAGLLEGRRLVEAGVGEVTVPVEADIAPAEAAVRAIANQRLSGPTIVPQIDLGALLAKEAVARSMPAWASAMQGNLGWDFNVARWRQMSGPTGGQFATDAMMAELARSLTAEQKAGIPAAALAAIAGASSGVATQSSGGGGGGGRGGFLGALLGSSGFAGKGGLTAALGAALVGKTTFGLPGFGSILGLAGLGPEHLAMTGIGLAGSLGGALLGGGLLGAGALGVAGVGMGTDLAGIGQAAGDIKNVYMAMNNLNTAVGEYGRTSTQAVQAQAALDQAMQAFSPVAQDAVYQAAMTAQGFKAMFDQWTGPAEGTGAQILTQLMQTAESFLPVIGKFAATNMVIIQTAIQPFLQWLQGQGLQIFTQLEQIFTNNLPSGVDALSQGFEFIAKTVGYVATHFLGDVVPKLDIFITKWNGVDFGRWTTEVNHLVGLFHTWFGFADIVAKDVYQIFHADAGTGQSIVSTLTAMLTQLHNWLESTSGQASLHNVFEQHKQEVLELLGLLPGLAQSLGTLELTATPALTAAVAGFVRDALVPLLNAVVKIPGGSFALGLAILMRMGPLSGVLAPLGRVGWSAIGAGILALGKATGTLTAGGAASLVTYGDALGALAAGVGSYYGATKLLDTIFGKPQNVKPSTSLTPQTVQYIKAYDSALINEAQAGLNAGPAIQLPPPHIDKWQQTKQDFTTWWQDLNNITSSYGRQIVGLFDGSWQQVDRDTRNWFGDVEGFFIRLWGGIERDAGNWGRDVYNALDSAWQAVDRDVRHWFGDVETFFQQMPGKILGFLSKLPGQMLSLGKSIIQGLLTGITDVMSGVAGWVNTHIVQPVITAVKHFFGIHSPSTVMAGLGEQVMQGFVTGLLKANPMSVVKTVFGSVANAVTDIVGSIGGSGTAAGIAGAHLSTAAANQILAALGGSPASSAGGFAAIQALGQQMAAQMGWTGAQWTALNNIVMAESGWNPAAKNPTSTAYGIAQNIGGPAGYGSYGLSPAGQIQWMLSYIAGRYGNPEAAWAFHLAHGTYAGGTSYAPGGWAMVGEQGRELVNLPRGSRVFSNGQTEAMLGGGGGPIQINLVLDSRTIGTALVNPVQAGLLRKQRLNVRVV